MKAQTNVEIIASEVDEEKKDEKQIPTLCTFDVRDKKTTFQTSCYVKRDIVSVAATTTLQSTLDSRFGTMPSRNQNKNKNNEKPFGLRSTLLQDSLNSVISTSYK